MLQQRKASETKQTKNPSYDFNTITPNGVLATTVLHSVKTPPPKQGSPHSSPMRANTLLLEPGPYTCNNCSKGKEKNRGKRQSWDSSVSSKSCHRCQCQSKGQETQPVSLANKYVHFSSQQNLAAQLLNFSLLHFFFLLVSHLKKEFKFKGNKPHIYAGSFAS